MFAYPLLPRFPAHLRPSTLAAPIKNLLSLPTSIDYSSIHPSTSLPNGNSNTAKHTGPLADLPKSTCPICHLRSTTTPVPLAAGISLPPASNTTTAQEVGTEDERSFVPAQTDCWGGCRWCYYCIMGELAALNDPERVAQHDASAKKDEPPKWDCLRCGGTVTQAWRAGPEMSPEVLDKLEESDTVVDKEDVVVA